MAEVEIVHERKRDCELRANRSAGQRGRQCMADSSRVRILEGDRNDRLRTEFTSGMRVVFQGGGRRVIAEIRGTQAADLGPHPTMQPIIARQLRADPAAALLMRMLAEHPDIIVEERYPYGNVCLRLLDTFLGVQGASMDASASENGQEFIKPVYFCNGCLRLPLFLYRSQPAPCLRSKRHPRPLVPALMRARGIGPRGAGRRRVVLSAPERRRAKTRPPPYFAEKGFSCPAGHCRWIMRRLYPKGHTEVVLFPEPGTISPRCWRSMPSCRVVDGFGEKLWSLEATNDCVRLVRGSILSITRLWNFGPGGRQRALSVMKRTSSRSPGEEDAQECWNMPLGA